MSRLRVGFDLSVLVHPHPRGVTRSATGLLEALEERGRLDVVRLAPPPETKPRRWRRTGLIRAVTKEGLAGLHSFTSAFAWRGEGKRVQTIHEVPWKHGVEENADWRHRFWASLGRRRADRVVCPSVHVARDLRPGWTPDDPKIRVIPWGVGPSFDVDPPRGVVDEVVLERYRLAEDPFVLCLGAVRAKKNLAAVLRGLAALRDRRTTTIRLVVTGPDTQELRRSLGLASQLGLAPWVTTLDEVEEADLPSLLRLATAVCVLSHSEGFGLPVLEAMACGTPAIVPPRSAQAEVAGEEGILVSPDDPQSVADGLLRAVAERESLRYTLAERARAFTWDACAERFEELWGELA